MKKIIFLFSLIPSFVFAEKFTEKFSCKKNDYIEFLSLILTNKTDSIELLETLESIKRSLTPDTRISYYDLLDLLLCSEKYTFELSQLLEKFKKITMLHFYKSNISNFPNGISLFENLEYLSISGYKHLNTLPNDIVLLEKLKELRITNTPIKSFPIGFARLKNLTEIDFNIGVLADCFIKKEKNITEIDNLPKNLKKYNTYDPTNNIGDSARIYIKIDVIPFLKSNNIIPGQASY